METDTIIKTLPSAVKNYDFTVILLPSMDGQKWLQPIIGPPGWNDEPGLQALLDQAKKDASPDWTWEDLEIVLEKAGFIVPDWVYTDVYWDEG